MDKQFFGEQIGRLRATYAAGSLNDERVQVLWDRFKGVENRVFKNAVDYLISEYTTLTLPAISRFAEAVGMFRTGTSAAMNLSPPAHNCEACRDFGFGFVGDVVVACVCHMGSKVSPQELALQQKHYDVGRKLFPMPGMGKPKISNAFSALPYDPKTSVAETDGVTR